MVDKKETAIVALLVLLVFTGVGWLSSVRKSTSDNALPVPYDNTYSWATIFHGYEAYLDRSISYSTPSGTSMEPTFGEGDAVIWAGVENIAELKVGDIIIYNHPTKPGEGPIAHRIINIMKNGEYKFETKGDNRSESDAQTAISAYYVMEDDLKGLVIGVVYNISSG